MEAMKGEKMEANENREVKDYTGVSVPTQGAVDTGCAAVLQRGKEEDIVTALLEAAEFRSDEDLVTPIELKRNGKLLFTFRVRPVSDEELNYVRKQTRKMYKNPAGKKYPPIEGSIDLAKFNSRLIYVATVEEDRERIWGQRAVMDRYDLVEPWETVGIVLTAGEKNRITDVILTISGMNEDADADEEEDEGTEKLESLEDYAKN